MTSDNTSRKILLVIMTGVIIMGVLTAYAIGTLLIDPSDDPYTESHEYRVTGSYDGVRVSGTGESVYVPESNREYSHIVDTKVKLPDGGEASISFMYFFTSSGPIDIYRSLGETTLDGMVVDVWQYDTPDATVTFMTDDDLRIVQYSLKGETWDIIGTIVG